MVVKANSKKERAAKAQEKQLKVVRQQAKATSGPPSSLRDYRSAPVVSTGTAPPPPPLVMHGDSLSEEITKLAALHEAGSLTDEEFSAAKAQLLGH